MLRLRLQFGYNFEENTGIEALENVRSLLARVAQYIQYQEKLGVSREIYGGNSEKTEIGKWEMMKEYRTKE